jgi:hypothetical protein
MPLLDRAYLEHKDELLVLGVAVEDTMANLEAFKEEVTVSYPLVADLDKLLYDDLVQIQGLPQTFFVNAAGEIIDEGPAAPIAGELDPDELEAAIRFLLDAPG